MINPEEKAVLRDFARVADRVAIPFVLVGAGARLLMLDWKYDLRSTRTTTDWDMGVQVGDWEDFRKLRTALTGGPEGVFREGRVAHRFHHTTGVAIDVVPFGGIERENGSITMPQDDTHMVVLGFQEVLENAVGVDIGRGISIPVATPPGLAVLKVFAYQDRRRTEDLRDLWFILENYDRAGNEERIFQELSHLLSEGALEYDVAGAYLLGSDAARMITGKTREHLLIALAQFSDPYSPDFAPLVSRLGDEREEETERIRVSQLFNSFRSGIERAM